MTDDPPDLHPSPLRRLGNVEADRPGKDKIMLFRQEVLDQKADRLTGEVSVAVPLAWQAVGYLMFGGIAVAAAFTGLASYSRIETVGGSIVPDAGVSLILPGRLGTISEIPVRDGQLVAAGTPLIRIRAEEDGPASGTTLATVASAIARQDSSLALQLAAVDAASRSERMQLEAQRGGLSAEIAQLESQLTYQQRLVAAGRDDIARTREVAANGFISAREMRLRDENLIGREQSLSQITQALAAKRSALAQADRSAAGMAAQGNAQSAAIAASRAQVAQVAANTDGSRGYIIRAPFRGRVSAMTAKVGQQVAGQSPLMTIVPEGSVLRAQLAVPTSAIGFVKAGQEVRLAIDAFPFQKFGIISGRILAVPESAIPQLGANGMTVAVYPVTVALSRAGVKAYGQREALLPGMSLSARIVTNRQTLLEWLFEPLFAVGKR